MALGGNISGAPRMHAEHKNTQDENLGHGISKLEVVLCLLQSHQASLTRPLTPLNSRIGSCGDVNYGAHIDLLYFP